METINAKNFMREMENLINSPSQRLIGKANGGYVYTDTDTPTFMYAATEISKAKREAEAAKARLAHNIAISQPVIKKVVFNDPATIVFWEDGTKTVVKAKNETFDPEKGLAMAISKKTLGNRGNYYNTIRKYIDESYEQQNEKNGILDVLTSAIGNRPVNR